MSVTRPSLVLALSLALQGCLIPDSLVDALLDADGDGHRTSAVGGDDCDDANPDVHPGVEEICGNQVDDNCDGGVDDGGEGSLILYADGDGDGFGRDGTGRATCYDPDEPPEGFALEAGDCDDGKDDVSPGAPELACNDRDDDCDTQIDEEGTPPTWHADVDGDGYGDPDATIAQCDAPADHVQDGTDCDDTDPSVNPGGTETWYDGVDADCDGADDFDRDGDGAPGAPDGSGAPLDCDDLDPGAFPGQAEVFYDGTDQDCDPTNEWDQDGDGRTAPGAPSGTADDCDDTDLSVGGPSTWFIDIDADGFGEVGSSVVQCQAPPFGVLIGGDCADGNPAINPGALEVCDQIDNDCDGTPDDGAGAFWFLDGDLDGVGSGAPTQACVPPGANWVNVGGDCEDADPSISPLLFESCDGVDNNCNGTTDEAGTPVSWFEDGDGDTYGANVSETVTCAAPASDWVLRGGDCDDAVSTSFPGAPDAWYDGVDSDCDGSNDHDQDGDGVMAASGGAPSIDCNDTDPSTYPGAPEVWYDGVDQDCDPTTEWDQDGDGLTWQGAPVGSADDCDDQDGGIGASPVWYSDVDGDGYGEIGSAVTQCSAPPNAVSIGGDCDDSDATRYPGAPELCDQLDNDCNGTPDDNVGASWFVDGDGDGAGTGVGIQSCTPVGDRVSVDGDCDDSDASISPFASEACDGIDNDCDGSTDESGLAVSWYLDGDDDGFGANATAQTTCAAPSPDHVLFGDDCDDTDDAIYPGAFDAWYDGVDADCDQADDYDQDGDGFTTAGGGSAQIDCDDTDASVNPGASEIWYDGIDQDCDPSTEWDADGDGYTDVGAPVGTANDCDDSNASILGPDTWYVDNDGDGYGLQAQPFCSDPGPGYSAVGGDCNDGVFAINPSAAEICDGDDNNCDGDIDEGVLTSFFLDEDGDGYGVDEETVIGCTAPFGYVPESGDCLDNNPAVHPNATEVCDTADNDCDASTPYEGAVCNSVDPYLYQGKIYISPSFPAPAQDYQWRVDWCVGRGYDVWFPETLFEHSLVYNYFFHAGDEVYISMEAASNCGPAMMVYSHITDQCSSYSDQIGPQDDYSNSYYATPMVTTTTYSPAGWEHIPQSDITTLDWACEADFPNE